MGSVVSSVTNAVGGLGKYIGGNVGSIGGGIADASGATNGYQTALTPEQQQQLAKAIMDQQQGFASNMANQNSLAQALLAQSQGQGVNLADQQLKNATNRNIQQATGMVASQKGINPAMAARLASQNAATANQTAAGQSAQLRAEQQLAAQGQLAKVYGSMGEQSNQNIHAANSALTGNENINANVATNNASLRGNIAGGLLNGAGGLGAALLARGGVVPGKAEVSGDSLENDKVHTMLSPGEIVIPRTKANDPDKAKQFIDHIMKNKKGAKVESYGDVVKAHRELKSRVAELEKKLKAKKGA
jgi:hypothetical protein